MKTILMMIVLGLPAPSQQDSLIIGVKEAAPFVLRGDDGAWTGITIELMDTIAGALGRAVAWREIADLETLLAAVENGNVDVGAGALTITAAREARFDFSQPFHVTGLAIAIRSESRAGWLGVVRQFASPDFLRVLVVWALLLLIVGLVVWSFERRTNDQFQSRNALGGILSGFWFSAVTMTTVGYGDKAPRTAGGRVITLIWMFTSLIIISTFTAAIASALTVGGLSGVVENEDDLRSARVGTVDASTSATWLSDRRIGAQVYPDLDAALTALSLDALDAVVYDAPLLRYRINENHAGTLRVLMPTLDVQLYGLALPEDSPLREALDRALLTWLTTDAWGDVLFRWLGKE